MYTAKTKKFISAALALVAMAGLSCSSELRDSAAPVELVLSFTQALHTIDLEGTATGCGESIGLVNMSVFPKNTTAVGDLVSVRVTRYRVSYRRVDGGTQVPNSFVRAIDTLINVNQSGGISSFVVFENDALRAAPFQALLPQNGGRDPETNSRFVKMEVILEVFGETLGGDNVYDATAFQLDFCFDCGGCR